MYLENKIYEMENLFHNYFNYCWNNSWKNISNNNSIMKNNVTYIWSDTVVDNIARKVAEEPMENVDEGNYEYMPKMKSQHIDHVETERLVDLERERERDRRQMEMFNDPWENWSGHR